MSFRIRSAVLVSGAFAHTFAWLSSLASRRAEAAFGAVHTSQERMMVKRDRLEQKCREKQARLRQRGEGLLDASAEAWAGANESFALHKGAKAALVDHEFNQELDATSELRSRAAALAAAAEDMKREAASRAITARNVRDAKMAHIENLSL